MDKLEYSCQYANVYVASHSYGLSAGARTYHVTANEARKLAKYNYCLMKKKEYKFFAVLGNV